MARKITLTTKRVERALKRPGRYRDSQVRGLLLVVVGDNSAAWTLRYELGGRERWLGLGSAREFGLRQARERALAARRQLADGIDPLDARRAGRAAQALEAAKALTFEQAAVAYFNQHERKWKNAKHRAQFLSTLKAYAYPTIGSIAVADIDTGLVLRCLQPIWHNKTETASRVRSRIQSVLDWAKAMSFRTGDNPAAWATIGKLLPARGQIQKTKPHPALPFIQAGEFMAVLKQRPGVAARALQFTILTACRTGDIVGGGREAKPPMLWGHVDFKERVWTVPSTKTATVHRVPLSEPAIALLRALPREAGNPAVFIGLGSGGLSNAAMAAVVRRINADRAARGLPRFVDPKQDNREIVPHGFRSSFMDWAHERTAYPKVAIDMALAHVVGDRVEAAYRRGDLFAKRIKLMADWAAFCAQPARSADVVPLRKGKR